MPLWLIALIVALFMQAAQYFGEPGDRFVRMVFGVILIVFAVLLCFEHDRTIFG